MIAQHGLPLLLRPFLNARRKRDLPLAVGRDIPPSLLEALDRLFRDAQQPGHLRLGFLKGVTNQGEFFPFHYDSTPLAPAEQGARSRHPPTSPLSRGRFFGLLNGPKR